MSDLLLQSQFFFSKIDIDLTPLAASMCCFWILKQWSWLVEIYTCS